MIFRLSTDFICLYTRVLPFPSEDCSEFGNFVITFIYGSTIAQVMHWEKLRKLIFKKKCVISNTGCLFSFNSNISNLYNNSIVAKQMVCHVFPLRLLNGFTDLYFANHSLSSIKIVVCHTTLCRECYQ